MEVRNSAIEFFGRTSDQVAASSVGKSKIILSRSDFITKFPVVSIVLSNLPPRFTGINLIVKIN
ncbi:MAG: hypothetical protein IKN16_11115 [Selenomonadaceae bacterium]|nr:hypothetical protein [Selenomonadaceae bacterium]MBR6888972.1 hypothetical protein [Selenomonadaceae bacterium]